MKWIWMVIGAVAVAAVAFFGGVFVGRATAPTLGAGSFNRQGMNGANGQNGSRASGMATGTVVSATAEGMTVKTADGSTKNVVFSSTTRIVRSEEISGTALKAGEKVSTFGQAGSDGTITARVVSIGSVTPFPGMGGGFRANGGAGGSNGSNSGSNSGQGGPPPDGGMGGPPPGQ